MLILPWTTNRLGLLHVQNLYYIFLDLWNAKCHKLIFFLGINFRASQFPKCYINLYSTKCYIITFSALESFILKYRLIGGEEQKGGVSWKSGEIFQNGRLRAVNSVLFIHKPMYLYRIYQQHIVMKYKRTISEIPE